VLGLLAAVASLLLYAWGNAATDGQVRSAPVDSPAETAPGRATETIRRVATSSARMVPKTPPAQLAAQPVPSSDVFVRGRVRFERGVPAAGAVVFVNSNTGPGRLSALAGEDGTYLLGPLPPTAHVVYAALDGFRSGGPGYVPAGAPAEHVVDHILFPAVAIEGVVVDRAGSPVADAELTAIAQKEPAQLNVWDVAHARTKQDGTFALYVDPGAFRIRVDSLAHLPLEERAEAPGRGLRLVLRHGGTLLVSVEDEEGAPVSGARLIVHQGPGDDLDHDDETRRHRDDRVAWLDANGRAQVGGLIRSEGSLTVRSEGLRLSQRVQLPVSGTRSHLLIVRRKETLAGRVLNEAGSPIAGALVSAASEDEEARSRTDGAGYFRVEGLPRAEVKISVKHALFEPWTRAASVNGEELLEVVLRARLALQARVTDEQGVPLAEILAGGSPVPVGIDGSMFMPVLRRLNDHPLVLSAPGFAPLTVRVTTQGRVTDLGELRLARGRALAGVVREGGTDIPLSGVRVALRAARTGLASEITHTGPGGEFTLSAIGLETDALVASHEGFLEALVPLPAMDPMVIRLQRGAPISFRARFADGQTATGVVSGSGPAGAITSVRISGGEGQSQLVPGAWSFVFVPASDGRPFEVERAELAATRPATVTFTEVPAGVDVALRGQSGERVLAVLLRGTWALPRTKAESAELLSADRRFAHEGLFRKMRSGEHTLLVLRPSDTAGARAQLRPVSLTAAPGQTLELISPAQWHLLGPEHGPLEQLLLLEALTAF
jgi:hypothetical protein